MTWTLVGAQFFPRSEVGVYKVFTFEPSDTALAYGVAFATPNEIEFPRLRVGFYYPFINLDEREYCGPSEEAFRGLLDRPRAIHFLDYRYLGQWPNASQRLVRYGCAAAPDRGATPCTVEFWRLT